MTKQDTAPGWDAIDAALAHVHGGAGPAFHLATDLPQRVDFGGTEALDGISVYRADTPTSWHLVTYGLSELYVKVTDDPEWSGWGLELTLRVPRPSEDCPTWAVRLLQQVSNAMQATQRPYQPGHRVDVRGPLVPSTAACLSAILLADDPELGLIDTPHGRLRFLRLVGVTAAELALAKERGTEWVIEQLRRRDPGLVTNPDRTWFVTAAGDAR